MFSNIKRCTKSVTRCQNGAALIEYSVLIGILVVAVITIITAVGGWMNTQWTTVNTLVNP